MSIVSTCRCCMQRPPDKDLAVPYKSLGKSEVYADMLKDCFEIHLKLSNLEGNNGICEVCIMRLRDACDFKKQVQHCQKHIQSASYLIKNESEAHVKFELSDDDDDNEIYFLDVEDEMSDFDELRDDEDDDDDEDDKKLVEILGFNDITVTRKHAEDKKRSKKRALITDTKIIDVKDEISDFDELRDDDDDEDDKKLVEILGFNDITVKRKHADHKKRSKKRALITDTKIVEKKSKKLSTAPLQLTLRTISEMNKMLTPGKVLPKMSFIPESTKYRVNLDNILKYSNCTPFFNKTFSGIFCAYCRKIFPKIEELRDHTRENHKNENLIDKKRVDKNNLSFKMDITDLKCNVCMSGFDLISNLKKHLSREHDVKFYTDVHDYILEFKLTDSEMLNCALCNSTFETFKMLLQHMNGHYRNFICEVCDLGFINNHRLKSHLRTHETGDFNCSYCDKVFSTRVKKMCHEKYTHNSNARYTTNCPYCDLSFTSYYQRNRHMFKEHDSVAATYKCNICDKSFILKSKLTAHIKKVHLMERNHICAECGQGFFIKQSLDEHMIKHNGERVFKCTVCPKAYARKKTLREHMRIHNNDRRFKCGICALAFVQKCSLKSHMLSNHGVTLAEYEHSRSDLCSPESL